MDGVINVRVNGYSIVKDHNCAGAQYESGSTKLRIEFDEVWDKFVKTVTFWDALGQNPTKIIMGTVNETESKGVYSVPIPGEVLQEAGMITFTVNGYSGGVIKRTVTDSLKVLPSRKADDAEEPTEATPTPHEQLQLEIVATEEKLKEFYQGGETDTVETEVGYVTTEEYEANAGESVLVEVEENDVKHIISSTDLESKVVIEAYDYENKRTYTKSFRGSCEVPQNILALGKKYGYYIRSEAKSVITVAKTSERKSVSSKVKEKSIGLRHLADEVGEKLDSIPTKTSQLENDSGYLSEETDPTVPKWAKEPEKPTYTADEVGAMAKGETISKSQAGDGIITEDDMATPDKAGIVKIFKDGGLRLLPSYLPYEYLAINEATLIQIKGKSDFFHPITPEMFDLALAEGTHQEISAEYDPSSLYTCFDMEGKQGRLPVSYDAVKAYVYSKNDVESLLGNFYFKAEVQAMFSDYYTKQEVDGMVGDIESALDELHAYAQALVSGGVN